jgi:hypothetical protein
LVDDAESIRDLLLSHGDLVKYAVCTIYLKRTRNPKALINYRARLYGDGVIWLETKSHIDDQVTKYRRPVTNVPQGLIPVASVNYEREVFEFGQTRVTIDTDICCGSVRLQNTVVEVKSSSDIEIPSWLVDVLPPENLYFSKRKWASVND